MKEVLWKLVGEDFQILMSADKNIRNRFLYSGVIMLLICLISLIGFTQLLFLMFNHFPIIVVISLFLTWLFFNIYKLCLITLSVRAKIYNIGYVFSLLIRVVFISFMAIIISKGFEYFLFNTVFPYFNFQSQIGFILNAINELNNNVPGIWAITFLTILLIISPFIIKFTVKPDDKYFSIQENINREIILNNYEDFKSLYNQEFLNNFSLNINVKEKFYDPPFNKSPIIDKRVYGTNKDFLKVFEIGED